MSVPNRYFRLLLPENFSNKSENWWKPFFVAIYMFQPGWFGVEWPIYSRIVQTAYMYHCIHFLIRNDCNDFTLLLYKICNSITVVIWKNPEKQNSTLIQCFVGFVRIFVLGTYFSFCRGLIRHLGETDEKISGMRCSAVSQETRAWQFTYFYSYLLVYF